MTPDELELLKTISGANVETFLPAGRSAAQAKAFDELVERLQALKRPRMRGTGRSSYWGSEWTTRSVIDFVNM